MPEATLAQIYDPAQVRLAQLGEQLLAEQAADVATDSTVAACLHLLLGLEHVAGLPLADERTDRAVGQLIEQYALGAVGLDPLLRPLLPGVPATGATVRQRALSLRPGRVLCLRAGRALCLRAELVPATVPSYNTTLLPPDSTGGISFNGLAGTSLEVDTPVATGSQPLYLKLLVDGTQLGRVDFPVAALGRGFVLRYAGAAYVGAFQQTSDHTLTLTAS